MHALNPAAVAIILLATATVVVVVVVVVCVATSKAAKEAAALLRLPLLLALARWRALRIWHVPLAALHINLHAALARCRQVLAAARCAHKHRRRIRARALREERLLRVGHVHGAERGANALQLAATRPVVNLDHGAARPLRLPLLPRDDHCNNGKHNQQCTASPAANCHSLLPRARAVVGIRVRRRKWRLRGRRLRRWHSGGWWRRRGRERRRGRHCNRKRRLRTHTVARRRGNGNGLYHNARVLHCLLQHARARHLGKLLHHRVELLELLLRLLVRRRHCAVVGVQDLNLNVQARVTTSS